MSPLKNEPFAGHMGITLVEKGEGRAVVCMTVEPGMANLFGMAHGGAVFGLIDSAFEIACNTRETAAVALNVSVTYVRGAKLGETLTATAEESSLTPKTGTYSITVRGEDGTTVALAQALAYRKKSPPPF